MTAGLSCPPRDGNELPGRRRRCREKEASRARGRLDAGELSEEAPWAKPPEDITGGATEGRGWEGADPKHERQISGRVGAGGGKGNPFSLVK